MKTIFKTLLASLFALALITMSSCKKDKNDPGTCELSSIKITDTYNGETDVELLNVVYDGDGVLKELASPDFNAKFFYNNQGKINTIEFHEDGMIESRTIIEWDGKKATLTYYWSEDGTLVLSDFREVYHFNDSDEITKIESHSNYYGGTWVMFAYDDFTWQNGNVTKIEEYYIDWDMKSSHVGLRSNKGLLLRTPKKPAIDLAEVLEKSESVDFVKEYTTTFTYDDKINPFSLHQAFRFLSGWPSFLSKNNVLTETELDHYDNTQDVSTLTYEYNNRNFPVKMTNASEGWSTVWEMSYVCD